MLPLGNKAVISHIIDSYPDNYEFLVGLGHKGDYLKQYLEITHKNKNIKFIDINPYEGPDSGLGFTLSKMCENIDQPFYFHTNDAIFLDSNPEFDSDTMVLSNENFDPLNYRSVTIDESTNSVLKVNDKNIKLIDNTFNYTGVAFIKNYSDFIDFLGNMSTQIGETDYFMNLDPTSISYYISDTWRDIGSLDGLRYLNKELISINNLPKSNEAIYFYDDRVIKFSGDKKFIEGRKIRNKKLRGLSPKIIESSENFYSYKFVEGEILSNNLAPQSHLINLLDWSKKNLWQEINLDQSEKLTFKNNCRIFYYEKTIERINYFHEIHGYLDEDHVINGKQMPRLETILKSLDWESLFDGIPCLYHGDFHFENIISTDEGFSLIDWRQSFGNLYDYGDMYYDLAKLLHGFWINHKIINDNHFEIKKEDKLVNFDIHKRKSLVDCEIILQKYVEENNLNWKKVKILASLILLNISPLHHYPYSELLYFYGKERLSELLK